MHIPSECRPNGNVAVCLCNQDYFYITHLIFFFSLGLQTLFSLFKFVCMSLCTWLHPQ